MNSLALLPKVDRAWAACRFATCSVLPVRIACNLTCPFCFSRSSISALSAERVDWGALDLERYYRFARAKGATRLVITGGGEPLLRPDLTLEAIARGRPFFDEIACFTNGARLTPSLSSALSKAGLSYICYSRHSEDDRECRALMGEDCPDLERFFEAAGPLKVRATCVMTQNAVEGPQRVFQYIEKLARFGVREFTFKHTYVAYEGSLFQGSQQDRWSRAHGVERDPFVGRGEVIASLPWGPQIRKIGPYQVCYYYEPTPAWEKEHGQCRSSNLLSDGRVYASLEQTQSLLFRLRSSTRP